MREYLRIAFNRVPIGVQRKNTLQRVVHGMIGFPRAGGWIITFIRFPFELG